MYFCSSVKKNIQRVEICSYVLLSKNKMTVLLSKNKMTVLLSKK